MKKKSDFTKLGFLKTYLLPVLIIFLIPGFGYWFFNHVEAYFDNDFRTAIVARLKADQTRSTEEREAALKFYERVPVSRILASNKPEAADMQRRFSEVSTRYAIFRWMKRTAAACLFSGGGAFIAVGLSVLLSFRSQQAQYWSLRLGWTILRVFALIQVVGQGVLAVALSFWVTAFWTESYYIKLIVIAGIFAFLGVAALVKAILSRDTSDNSFEGLQLKPETAPALWQRVADLAAKMGIAPPDNIFVGIDHNFFVTEHPMKVGGQQFEGRSLYMSLSLLKTMTRAEADGVLAHELAHFSGEDTLYSKRISPLLGKYERYLNALYHGGLSRPVFHFMFFFWNLYQISLGKLRRQREFRADRIGSEHTSPQAMAQALIKVTAYCQYRHQVQVGLFNKDENVETMNVFTRIEQGFPEFIAACASTNELAESDSPHPFDSHPPLTARLGSLGLDSAATLKTPVTPPAAGDSWFAAIEGAGEMEAAQWKAFEDRFHEAHKRELAWRFKPEGDAEIQHVLQYFPEVQFTGVGGLTATLTYAQVNVSSWEAPLALTSVISCSLDKRSENGRLTIHYHDAEGAKRFRQISLSDFPAAEGKAHFLNVFENYYGRHVTSQKYHEEKASAEAAKAKNADGKV